MMSRTQTDIKRMLPDVEEVLGALVEWQDEQEVLGVAICDTLLSLGWPITKTILWHLNRNGFFLSTKEEIDVQLFYQQLRQIVGYGADMIVNHVYENVQRRGGQKI